MNTSPDKSRDSECPVESTSEELEKKVREWLHRNKVTSETFDHGNLATIGRFEIREVLSRNGQAIVYLAFDPVLQRKVVLKVYLRSFTPAQRARMIAEGRALASIESPCVVNCLGVEEFEDIPFLVLPYVAGKTLQDVIEADGPLKPRHALTLVRQLSEGLRHVHRLGLLHRDLKPGNVMIQGDHPVLVDFGLATRPADLNPDDTSGTPAFMAPEQADGDDHQIDQRADIYGLGAILHFALTGFPPGEGALPKLSPRSLRLLNKCLQEDPQARYEDVGQLIHEIDGIGNRSRRKKIVFATIGIMIAALVLLISQGFFTQDTGVSAMTPDDLQNRILREDFDLDVDLLVSGKSVLPDEQDIYHLALGSEIQVRVTPERDCKVIAVSFQCSELSTEINESVEVFPQGGESKEVELTGGHTYTRPESRRVTCGTVSPRPEYLVLVAWTGTASVETVFARVRALFEKQPDFVGHADETWRGLGDKESELGLTSCRSMTYLVSEEE